MFSSGHWQFDPFFTIPSALTKAASLWTCCCVCCAVNRCHLALWPSCQGSWCTPTRSRRCSVTTGSPSALPSRLRKLLPAGWNVSLFIRPKPLFHFITITQQCCGTSSRGRCCTTVDQTTGARGLTSLWLLCNSPCESGKNLFFEVLEEFSPFPGNVQWTEMLL